MFRPSGLSDGRCAGGQRVSLVGLRAPPAIRQRGMSSLFGEQQISTLADAIRAALMLRYNDRMVG